MAEIYPYTKQEGEGDVPLTFPALQLNKQFNFDATMARRLTRREINPKEAFTLCDSAGIYFRATLKDLTDGGGSAMPYEKLTRSPEPSVEITLACAILARQRMIFVIQKATELGATRIVPLLTDFSVPPDGLEHEKAHAWPGQVIRAARQCRRSSLPDVLPPARLDAFLSSPSLADADLRLYLDDRADRNDPIAGNPKKIVLFVGPEGGFSDPERKLLEGRARPWILGGRVLRAETAVIVGLAAIHFSWGDYA